MFDNVSVICYASSYGVALLLEISRLFFRVPIRLVVMLGFAVAGLLAHGIVLWRDSQPGFEVGVPLSSWHLWYLLTAWLLAAVYVAWAIARPHTSLGVFMLPVVLGLTTAAQFAQRQDFSRNHAYSSWGAIHGVALLLGTVTASLGFVAGVMYLVQSYRLKHKLPPRPGFRLPSLEWLQVVNKQMLYWSSFFVAGGMFAGVILNMIRQGVPWTDRVVISSGVLLVWLIVATMFELFYKPAQQGRKIAYLTVASFIFLVMVLALSLSSSSPHAQAASAPGSSSGEVQP